jgi:hypothetical protein
MKFGGKLTQPDLKDVQKIVRSKMYWPKLLLANWYGLLLTCVVLWATVSGFMGYTKPNWRAVALIWLVLAGIFAWAIYRTKRGTVRALTQVNAILPDWVTLNNDGIQCDGPNGAKAFQPWRTFKQWREGRRVVLLEQSNGQRVILHVADLSEIERHTLRQLLQSCIPPTMTPGGQPNARQI